MRLVGLSSELSEDTVYGFVPIALALREKKI